MRGFSCGTEQRVRFGEFACFAMAAVAEDFFPVEHQNLEVRVLARDLTTSVTSVTSTLDSPTTQICLAKGSVLRRGDA